MTVELLASHDRRPPEVRFADRGFDSEIDPDLADMQARVASMITGKEPMVVGIDEFGALRARLDSLPRNIPASAPTDRKTRRALVKALGARQFKKLYRKAQA